MDRGPPVRVDAPVVRSAQKHAGSGRNTQPFDALARIQRRVDIHHERVVDVDHETVRTRETGRVEQAVHGELAGFPGGAFQIIGDEVRKLLGSRQTAIDREATLRHAVLQLAIDGAEIRGTLEGRNIALPVAMKQQPEAGKAEIGGERASVHTAPAIVKQGGIEAQLLRLRILDAVDPHRLLDREAQVKQLYPKAQPLTEPQRVIIAKADRLPLVPDQLGDRRRQLRSRPLIGRTGHRTRQALEPRIVEWYRGPQALYGRRARGLRRERVRPRDCGRSERRTGLKESTSKHTGNRRKYCAARQRRIYCNRCDRAARSSCRRYDCGSSAAASACAISSSKSSMSSRPIDRRTVPGPTPAMRCCCSLRPRLASICGGSTSESVAPKLAAIANSRSASVNLIPAAAPPRRLKLTTAPNSLICARASA